MSILKTIKKNNVLRGISLDVYAIIDKEPGLTVGEIYRRYKAKHPTTDRSRNELAKRVNDLMNWGAVYASGDATCSVSGRTAQVWVVTGKLPERTPRASTSTRSVVKSDLKPVTTVLRDAFKRQAEAMDLIVSSIKSGESHLDNLKELLADAEMNATKRYLFNGGAKRSAARQMADSLQFTINTLEFARKRLG